MHFVFIGFSFSRVLVLNYRKWGHHNNAYL